MVRIGIHAKLRPIDRPDKRSLISRMLPMNETTAARGSSPRITIIDRRPWWQVKYQSQSWGGWEKLLLPFSAVYAGISWLRHALQSGRSKSPSSRTPYVVSIGNLEMGGTGKTPFTRELARRLEQEGMRTAIVTRGYGVELTESTLCFDDENPGTYAEYGDEGGLYRRQLPRVPLILAARRRRGVEAAGSRYEADVVLLDDAFQHFAVQRHLDILLLNSNQPLGNRRLLPAGPLREGRWALGRADVVCFTGGERPNSGPRPELDAFLRDGTLRIAARAVPERFENLGSDDEHTLESLRDAAVIALSGIARAENFEDTLRSVGVRVVGSVRHPDHRRFSARDLKEVEDLRVELGAAWTATTEKDAVRLRSHFGAGRMLALTQRCEIHGVESLIELIRRKSR